MIYKIDNGATQDKFMKHIMTDPIFSQFPEIRNRMMRLPICPRCEKPALRDTRKYDPVQSGYFTCPSCGYHGPHTHTVDYHLENHVISKR